MYTMISEISITDDIEQHKEEMRQQMEAQQAKMAALETKLKSATNNIPESSTDGSESRQKQNNAQGGETNPPQPRNTG